MEIFFSLFYIHLFFHLPSVSVSFSLSFPYFFFIFSVYFLSFSSVFFLLISLITYFSSSLFFPPPFLSSPLSMPISSSIHPFSPLPPFFFLSISQHLSPFSIFPLFFHLFHLLLSVSHHPVPSSHFFPLPFLYPHLSPPISPLATREEKKRSGGGARAKRKLR